MDFSIPPDLQNYLNTLDKFIVEKINPIQARDDNDRFFDHRRENSRTNWDAGGLPTKDWEALLHESRKVADEAGHFRFALPKEYGGQEHKETNLWMAVIRDHLASKGLGLFNDLQNEHSIVGNFPVVLMFREFGSPEQKAEFISGSLNSTRTLCFGLTEPDHGSDATFMDTEAKPERRNGVDGYRLNGMKKWQTGMHVATHSIVFARTSPRGKGEGEGITAFIVPVETKGVEVLSYEW
jgi:acyl-CoA dehydrogenase